MRAHSAVSFNAFYYTFRYLINLDAYEDLMWSDPDDVDNWAVSPRGAGWLFGGSVAREVLFILCCLSPTLTLVFHAV